MKEYIYQNHRLYIFLLTIWIVIIIIGLLILAPSYMSFLFWLGLISTVVSLMTTPQILSKKIKVNDTGILESERKYIYSIKKGKKSFVGMKSDIFSMIMSDHYCSIHLINFIYFTLCLRIVFLNHLSELVFLGGLKITKTSWLKSYPE